jgi:pilus assembly protein Flp/PilA
MFDRLFVTLQVLRGDLAARFEQEEGATAVEYGLMVALIAVAIIGAVTAVGGQLTTLFNQVVGGLGGPPPTP